MDDVQALNELVRPHLVAEAEAPPKIFGLHIDEQPTPSLIQRLHKVWDASGLRELGHKLLIIGPEFRAEELGDGKLASLGLVRAEGETHLVVSHVSGKVRVQRLGRGHVLAGSEQVTELPDGMTAVVRPVLS